MTYKTVEECIANSERDSFEALKALKLSARMLKDFRASEPEDRWQSTKRNRIRQDLILQRLIQLDGELYRHTKLFIHKYKAIKKEIDADKNEIAEGIRRALE